MNMPAGLYCWFCNTPAATFDINMDGTPPTIKQTLDTRCSFISFSAPQFENRNAPIFPVSIMIVCLFHWSVLLNFTPPKSRVPLLYKHIILLIFQELTET